MSKHGYPIKTADFLSSWKSSESKEEKILSYLSAHLGVRVSILIKDSNLKGKNYVFCTLCNVDFKIGHSGNTDVKNHADTDKHKQIFYVSFIVFPSVQYF